MSGVELKGKFKALEDHILVLIYKYIEPHKDPLQGPEEYNLDVHSFCILCHAAFEEFIEDITLYSINRIDSEFNNNPRKFSYATLCLLHFDEHTNNLNEDKNWPEVFNDYIKKRIIARKCELSNYAMSENHGIDVKYLRKLLQPIGIEVPRNPKDISALTILKSIRGSYAHSYARNSKPLPPEDAERVVFDVLDMVNRIKDKALNMSYYVV